MHLLLVGKHTCCHRLNAKHGVPVLSIATQLLAMSDGHDLNNLPLALVLQHQVKEADQAEAGFFKRETIQEIMS